MNEFMIKLSYETWDSLIYSSDIDSLTYSSNVDSMFNSFLNTNSRIF